MSRGPSGMKLLSALGNSWFGRTVRSVRFAFIMALIAGVALAIYVGGVAADPNRWTRAAGLLLTTPIIISFILVVWPLARPGRDKEEEVTAAHLLGAAMWLIAVAFFMPLFRNAFAINICGPESTCYGVISAFQIVALAAAFGVTTAALLLWADPLSKLTRLEQASRRRFVWAAVGVGVFLATMALVAAPPTVTIVPQSEELVPVAPVLPIDGEAPG